MVLRDVDCLILETGSSAESLPDPTTCNGRTHLLSNTGLVTTVWSSVGATPFQQGGANVATLSVPRGTHLLVHSDGVHWVVKSSGQRPIVAASAVTDASGNATFAFPAGVFSAAPDVALAIQAAAGSNPIDYRIVTLTATSCVVNVRQSPTLVVLSLSVLGVAQPLAGVTVHAVATAAGVTP